MVMRCKYTKGLILGQQKSQREEMAGIPHHLFDVKEPHEPFSVAEYQMDVRKWMKDIQSRGKTPIIVGGTGLYIQSVLCGFPFYRTSGRPRSKETLGAGTS